MWMDDVTVDDLDGLDASLSETHVRYGSTLMMLIVLVPSLSVSLAALFPGFPWVILHRRKDQLEGYGITKQIKLHIPQISIEFIRNPLYEN